MQNYAIDRHRVTPQTVRSDPREVMNNAGGFVYGLNEFDRLRRFLILGADGATFYVSKREMVAGNYEAILTALRSDAERAIDIIVDVNVNGLAHKVDPQIFALAVASVDKRVAVRSLALSRLGDICRIPTHLFMFLQYRKQLGGKWGSLIRKVVGEWYSRDIHALAFGMTKYRNREGWTHRDVLRLAHVKPVSEKHNALFGWAVGGKVTPQAPQAVHTYESIRNETNPEKVVDFLVQNHHTPREYLSTEVLKDAGVWRAMLPNMPMTAMIRNLRNMSNYGVFNRECEELVVQKLRGIRGSMVHPMSVLIAMSEYKKEGNSSALIVGALNNAFHDAFVNVEPTGKRIMIGLDVSGSMGLPFNGSMSVRMAATAMSLVTVNVEDCADVYGFCNSITKLPIARGWNLNAAMKAVHGLPFGATDCSLPMQVALLEKKSYDAFIVYTDNETWAGKMKPMEALRRYRSAMGIHAKLVVVGMTSTGFTIADPEDGGAMDVVGFDAGVPAVISDFIKG